MYDVCLKYAILTFCPEASLLTFRSSAKYIFNTRTFVSTFFVIRHSDSPAKWPLSEPCHIQSQVSWCAQSFLLSCVSAVKSQVIREQPGECSATTVGEQ